MCLPIPSKGHYQSHDGRMRRVPQTSSPGKNGKYELFKQIDACFKCFGNHRRQDCPKKESCTCGSNQHHQLLCERKDPKERAQEERKDETSTRKETHVSLGNSSSLYPIYQVAVCGSNKSISVFLMEVPTQRTYITHQTAERIRANKLRKVTLDVTTMENVEKTHHTQQYSGEASPTIYSCYVNFLSVKTINF